MLHSMKDFENCAISATDGQIGHVKNLYFDDQSWVIRYLVVNAGSWLSSRMVLISPISLEQPDWQERIFPVSISKEQVKNSPGIDTDKPISRQNEEQHLGYFGYPYYWGGTSIWGDGFFPYAMVPYYADYETDHASHERQVEAYSRNGPNHLGNDDPHLRNCKTVNGYQIEARDGKIGSISDFLVDEKTWAIRYLVIETSHWWSGHRVLIAPEWITEVHWLDKKVSVNLTLDSVKNAPSYDPKKEWSRQLDIQLYQHYNRVGYWTDTTAHEESI